MRNFRNYDVWKNAISFSSLIYKMTAQFPAHERFGLTSQMQRASVSIASNIAEGASRKSDQEFARFLEISIGSAFEVETQVEIAKNQNYMSEEEYQDCILKLDIIQKQLNQFIITIRH